MTELPSTNDPFVLLGVPRDADLRALKRAYVRLIKVFRPDEQPEQFDRVRRAFEQARTLAESAHEKDAQHGDEGFANTESSVFTQALSSNGVEDARAPTLSGESLAHSEVDPLEPIRRDVANGQYATALSALEARAPHALDQALVALALRTASEAGDIEACARWWQRGIDKAVDMSALGGSLSLEVVQLLTTSGVLDWDRLRTQPNRAFAVWLYRGSAPLSCAAGRSAQILTELLSRSFETDLLSTPALESALWRVLSYAAWDDTERALSVLEAHQPDASADSPELDQLDTELAAARTWNKVRPRARPSPAFERALRYGALQNPFRDELGQEVAQDLQAQPEQWLRSIDVLCQEAPELSQRMLRAADAWVEGDGRVWDELTAGERAWLSAATRDLDRALERNWLNRLQTLFMSVLLLLVVGGFVAWGWWGLLSLVGCFGVAIASVQAVDRWLYPRVVRPLMLERFVMRGISPERMVEAIAQNKKLSDDMSRFDDAIEQDAGLYVLAALQRVRLERGVGSQSPAGMRHQAPVLTGACAQHPERVREATCAQCQRELCRECTERDAVLGDYCAKCRPQHLRAKRQYHLQAERHLRSLASLDLILGGVAIFMGAATARANGKHVGVLLAVGAILLLASVGLRLRAEWGRIVQIVACLPVLLAFPVGTLWGGSVLLKLNKRDWTEVFTEGHAQARAATPDITLPRLYWWLDAGGVAILLFSILALLRVAFR